MTTGPFECFDEEILRLFLANCDDNKTPSGLQDAAPFGENPGQFRSIKQLEGETREDPVKRGVGKRELCRITLMEFQVLRRQLPCLR